MNSNDQPSSIEMHRIKDPQASKPFVPLDANVYATKKTIAQGMLDVALLTANASQLKYLLQLGEKQDFFYVMVSLISLSIVLQLLVGILFIMVGYIDFNDHSRQKKLDILNNLSTIAIFLITTINILIAGFGLNVRDF